MLKLLIMIGIPITVCFLTVGIRDGIGTLLLIGIILLITHIVGIGFFSNYGISITPKSVKLINQHAFKTFRYEDVVYININFNNDCIFGEIKSRHQKTYSFKFDGIDLSSGSLFLSRFWISGLKLSDKFIEKSISKLEKCEKVNIRTVYSSKEE